MKKFKLFKMLAVLIVLITCSPQLKAATYPLTVNYPYVYLDNTDLKWNGANVVVGHDSYSYGYLMSNIGHTKLFYREIGNNWTDAKGIVFINATSEWGEWKNLSLNDRCKDQTRTQFIWDNNYESMDWHKTYYCTSTGSSNLTIDYKSGGWGDLNNNQTVKKYTRGDGAGSYSAASVNSGTVTISAYKMTGDGTASNSSNSSTINSAGTTSTYVPAACTGEVTVTASANTGYVFMGWYGSENGDDKKSSNSSYTYNAPKTTGTIYARFAEKLPVGKTLYLATNATWRGSSANFEAVFCNATTQKWVSCSPVTGTSDMYSVTVPSGDWGCVIFCRMNPSGTAHSWSGKWCQTDDMYKSGTYNCVKITGDCSNSQNWCRYSKDPVIIRSHNDWDPENADVMSISGNICTKSLEFNAKSTYQVKILDGTTEYGLNEHVVTSSISNYTIKSGEYQLRVATAGAGNYSFTYNKSNHQLSIAYPTVNHPSTDYCYVIDYSWGTPKLHIWGSSSGAAATSSVTAGPTLYNKVKIQGTNYFYIAPGDYANFLVSNNGDASNRTGDLNSSDGYGKYRHNSSDWKWSNWSFTVTLTEQVTTTYAPSDPTVQFNGTALTSIASKPACDYYTFGGYYTAAGGGGSQLIDANKAWKASVSGYTDGSKKWIHEGGTAELFAKWTQSVTLNQNGATTDGSTSLAATYNAVLDASSISNPERDYYTFAGWTNGSGGTGSVVIDENKAVQTVASWTDGSDKWIHNGASTLYAKWDEDTHMVTLANDGFGHVEINSSTVTSVSGIGVETASSTITAVPTPGYQFVNWTGDFGDGVTIASGSTTSASITINATADGKTITANYTPITYNGTVNGIDVSNGTYSVTFGESSLEVTSAPVKTGYHVQGYYLTYNTTLQSYSDPIAYPSETSLKALVESAHDATHTYTDNNSKWIYYNGDAPDIYIKWEANTHTLTLYKNDGTGDNIPTSVTYGSNVCTPTITIPTRAGYAFAGYWTAASGGSEIIRSDLSKIESSYFDASTSNWKYDGDVDLYAHWTPVALSFTNGGGDGSWTNTANWSPACVPTIEHDVTISVPVTVNTNSAKAKSVAFSGTGKITIPATGALEVAGTVASDDPEKLVINTSSSSQGALICNNSAGTTQATVELSLNSSRWQMIAIPVGYVNVSDAFVGSSVYTYVWKYGEGWERRGYYDGLAAFESVLIKGSAGKTFTGALVSTADKSFTASYDDSKVSGAVTMYGNSWPAPIAISGMDLTATADGAVHFFTGSGWEGGTISDYIPALQGYAVIAKSTGGTVKIPYSAVRAVPAANRNTALRAPKRTTSDIFDHITIYVSGNEWQTRIRLYENEQFSDEIDKGYEALYMEGEGIAGELYAQAAEKMNVLAVPDLEGTVVGFVPGQATSYTLSFEGDGRGYYLNDVETKKSTLIAEGNTYTFSRSDNDASRFIISRTPIQNLPTGVGNINDGAQARKVLIDNKIYIIRGGRMYDATGALVK